MGSPRNLWKHNTKLHEAAKEVLGEEYERQSRKMWRTEEREALVAKKKTLYQKMVKYKKA